MPPQKGFTKRRDIFTEEEIDKLISMCESSYNASQFKSLIAFLYISACRLNEVLSCTRSSFAFDDYNLYTRIKLSKNPDIAYRNLPPLSLNNKYIKLIVERLVDLNAADNLVWTISSKTFERKLKSIIPDAWIHLFRRTRLTMFAQKGFDPFKLQVWAGWSDTRPAKEYIQAAAIQ